MQCCCKSESRISETYCTNIQDEIQPVKVPKLVIVKRMLDSGKSIVDVMNNEDTFGVWCTYNRAFNQFMCIKQRSRNFKSLCFYLYGPPGVGKSWLASVICNMLFPGLEPFYKTKSIWWDGYVGNDCVVWDDFRGDCYEVQELLKLCDRYQYRIQVKGGFVNFVSKVIIFTSNKKSWNLYSGD
ncbi:uncharacterized protein LOC136078778 [Hydra vulgaris]|uniref:Uncharacterized protein LOC136078778 n=1 Tax=Hydra vulgaris TaxID=6087 RepID=A0ABM4BNH2_HYDVU